MSSYDTRYVRAESTYRAAQIRDGIVGRRARAALRAERRTRRARRRGISVETL